MTASTATTVLDDTRVPMPDVVEVHGRSQPDKDAVDCGPGDQVAVLGGGAGMMAACHRRPEQTAALIRLARHQRLGAVAFGGDFSRHALGKVPKRLLRGPCWPEAGQIL